MKAANKITPTLLGNPKVQKHYAITVELGNSRWAELIFSEREMAQMEYNRIKGQGIYCGAWIQTIELNERTDTN
jgi:hypothetical protein